jgi:hypothetical protein
MNTINMQLTPEQLIKKAIVERINEQNYDDYRQPVDTAEQIEAAYDLAVEKRIHWDFVNEFREGEVETEVTSPSSRHYESKSVAAKIDGVWVGWTYWYGGGKHGQPEAVEWMEDAYFLDCKEEEKVVMVITFTKK